MDNPSIGDTNKREKNTSITYNFETISQKNEKTIAFVTSNVKTLDDKITKFQRDVTISI